MRCSKCFEDGVINSQHSFAGYGWFEIYHPECCPVEMDGTVCREDHPTEEQQKKQRRLLALEEDGASSKGHIFKRVEGKNPFETAVINKVTDE